MNVIKGFKMQYYYVFGGMDVVKISDVLDNDLFGNTVIMINDYDLEILKEKAVTKGYEVKVTKHKPMIHNLGGVNINDTVQ